MHLFPVSFVSALLWTALALVAADVILLCALWLRDASKRDLW